MRMSGGHSLAAGLDGGDTLLCAQGRKGSESLLAYLSTKTTLPFMTQKCGLFIGFFLVGQANQIVGGEVVELADFYQIVDL